MSSLTSTIHEGALEAINFFLQSIMIWLMNFLAIKVKYVKKNRKKNFQIKIKQ